MKLYRAAGKEKYAGVGSCWTPQREHAEEYMDNPGFGGENIIEVEVNTSKAKMFYLDDFDGLMFAEILIELAGGMENIERFFMLDEGELLGMDYNAYPLPENWIDNETIREILAKEWDWVVYEDSFPAGAETWTKLR